MLEEALGTQIPSVLSNQMKIKIFQPTDQREYLYQTMKVKKR